MTDSGSEAKRVVYLGMVSAFENGLRRTLEEPLATLWTIKGDEAEAWLRSKSSRFPTATGGRGTGEGDRQFVRRAWGRVTVPGLASAARAAWSRYALGSAPQSFADSIRL